MSWTVQKKNKMKKSYNLSIGIPTCSVWGNFMPFKRPFGSSDSIVTGNSLSGFMNML